MFAKQLYKKIRKSTTFLNLHILQVLVLMKVLLFNTKVIYIYSEFGIVEKIMLVKMNSV